MSEGRDLGFLEKAIRLIPGYKGYKSKEERRDNDHLFLRAVGVGQQAGQPEEPAQRDTGWHEGTFRPEIGQ